MRSSVGVERTDGDLIAAARSGDADAYASLYRRHQGAAKAAARALSRSRADADDIVSEAFARVLRVLQNGGGPDLAFRPYLLTAVRNVHVDRVRRAREDSTEAIEDVANLSLLESMDLQEDREFVGRAFASLPERWQVVLWHTEVEGRAPAEVAPLLGLAPNAVAALAYRAREGLRQAFLQEHLRQPRPPGCEEIVGQLGAYVRDGLSPRARAAVDAHLASCDSCPALLAELAAENTALRVALVPVVVGVPAAAYLSGLHGGGVLTLLLRSPKRTQAAAIGAAAVLVIAAGSAAASSNNDSGLAFRKSLSEQMVTGITPAPQDAGRPPATLPVTVPPVRPTSPVLVTAPPFTVSTGTQAVFPTVALPTTVTTRTTTRVTAGPTTRATTRVTTRPTTRPTTASTAAPTTATTSPTTSTVAPAYAFDVTSSVELRRTLGGTAAAAFGGTAIAATAPLTATVHISIGNGSTVEVAGLTVKLLRPAAIASWSLVDTAPWGCSEQSGFIVCTATGSLAPGARIALELQFTGVGSAGFDLPLTVTSPVLATVTGTTDIVVPVTSDSLVLTLSTRSRPIVVASPAATTTTSAPAESTTTSASTTSTTVPGPVVLPAFSGPVRAAYLSWWTADTASTAVPAVSVTAGDAPAAHVAAAVDRTAPGIGRVGYADVTALIASAGPVTVTPDGPAPSFGWALVVVPDDPAGATARTVRVAMPAMEAHDNSGQDKGELQAQVVASNAAYQLPADVSAKGTLTLVAFDNVDAGETISGGGRAVTDPFTGGSAVYGEDVDGTTLQVSTTGEPFVVPLVVSSSGGPE